MGLQIRDDRQMKALTGLAQAQFDHLLPVFRDIYQATQQQTYAALRGDRPACPTLAEQLFSASENGGHHLWVTAPMQDGNHPQRLFLRRVGNQVLAHPNEAQGP